MYMKSNSKILNGYFLTGDMAKLEVWWSLEIYLWLT